MSYLVLARKYRPQTFESVIGQEHVTQTLTNSILSKRVAHAILFTGPRGTGKTTIARILAKSMNCAENKKGPVSTPCNLCRSCREITKGNATDVFEIDGASNNSVDQVRELRENIKYMPAQSPYKIYIIDEVHMLSTAAFNALLKTLEEPPPHVMFMFATTEPHKIPITILSRCQRHDLRRISLTSVSNHMASLCALEKTEIANESLEMIAREGGGSLRDSLSLLDQIISCSEGAITHEEILNILGIIDRKIIFEISGAIIQGEISKILNITDEVYSKGHDLKKLYYDLTEHFRNLLILKMGENTIHLVDVPGNEIELMQIQVKEISETFLHQILNLMFKDEVLIKHSTQPRLSLEMTFIKMFRVKPSLSMDLLIEKIDALRKDVDPSNKLLKTPDNNNQNRTAAQAKIQNTLSETRGSYVPIQPDTHTDVSKPDESHAYEKEPENTSMKNFQTPDQAWEQIFKIISKKHPSLAAFMEETTVKGLTGNTVELNITGNSFQIDMIKRKKNMDLLAGICGEFFEKSIELKINTIVQDNVINKDNGKLESEAINHPLVADTIEIFNGKIIDIKTL